MKPKDKVDHHEIRVMFLGEDEIDSRALTKDFSLR